MSDDKKIKNNELKAIQASSLNLRGYYRNLNIEDYNSFCVYPYSSFEKIISEIVLKKGECKILEICCGEGVVANSIISKYNSKVKYTAIDLLEPKQNKGFRFLKVGLDEFDINEKFDFIFSVNGLIYGFDDEKNFEKYLNLVENEGYLLFNFNGVSNPIEIEKKNDFYSFLSGYFLFALDELGFKSSLDDKGGNYCFFLKKIINRRVTFKEILRKSEELKKLKKLYYNFFFDSSLNEIEFENLEKNMKLIFEEFVLNNFNKSYLVKLNDELFSIKNLETYLFTGNLSIETYLNKFGLVLGNKNI